jgi:hypothetical protein
MPQRTNPFQQLAASIMASLSGINYRIEGKNIPEDFKIKTILNSLEKPPSPKAPLRFRGRYKYFTNISTLYFYSFFGDIRYALTFLVFIYILFWWGIRN